MRIIAGTCRSRSIVAPRGMETRPTYDRVRETVFDILQFEVPGSAVLDLYTGSGALALESLSRGAARAVMCDMDGEAVRVASRNAESLGLKDRCEVLRMTDSEALKALSARREAFDLIFLDPPYRMDLTEVLARIAASGLLTEDGIMAAEYRDHCPVTPPGYEVWKDRRMGRIFVRMFRRAKTEG